MACKLNAFIHGDKLLHAHQHAFLKNKAGFSNMYFSWFAGATYSIGVETRTCKLLGVTHIEVKGLMAKHEVLAVEISLKLNI